MTNFCLFFLFLFFIFFLLGTRASQGDGAAASPMLGLQTEDRGRSRTYTGMEAEIQNR